MKDKRKLKSLAFTSLIVFIAFGGALVSIFKLHLQIENHYKIVEQLKSVDDVYHEINEQILIGHSFNLPNFDKLVLLSDRSLSSCKSLFSDESVIRQQSDHQIMSLVEAFCLQNGSRLYAVEKFKSKNSILKNFVHLVPMFIEQKSEGVVKTLSLNIFNIAMKHSLTTRLEDAQRIDQLSQQMKNEARGNKEALGFVQAFGRHIDVFLKTSLERRELEELILSDKAAQPLAALTNGYLASYHAKEAWASHVRTALLLSCLALGSVLAALFYRLKGTSETLAELNQNLEEKVRKRTQDLTEALTKIEAQQEIVAHSTKMSALGEMSGSIAHEINTPLAAISMQAEFLIADVGALGLPEVEEGLHRIMKIVDKISKIVIGLRKFSRNDRNELCQIVLFQDILNDTLILCEEKLLKHNIQLIVEHQDPELRLYCAAQQVSQVLMNLLNNSIDAIDGQERKWIRIETKRTAEQGIIAVTDSGPGIPEEIRKKLMQPFFTTKAIGKGTGLGLSISKGLIEAQGGSFTYVDKENTCFEIRLPLEPVPEYMKNSA